MDLDKCSVSFLRLCEFLEKLSALKGKKKAENLKKFFENSSVTNFFPIVRLMIPLYDIERGQYGLKETTLGKLYAEILNLPVREKEALIHFKNPKKQFQGCPAGGFVEVLEFILSKRIGDSKSISIEEVNTQLDKLSNAIEKTEKKQVLRTLLCSMNALEQKWLVKVILKDMKIGAHEKILGTFHPKALEIYFHTNNLRQVFLKIKDGSIDRIGQLYSLGQPIRPMLAGRKSYQELKKLLHSVELTVETKYDGERIQIHIDGEEVQFFSRNAVDYSTMYGKSMKTAVLRAMKGLKSCIIDGELIVWDIENNRAARFGQNKTVAIDETPGLCLCYKAFDLLYCETRDGSRYDLLPRPLSERKELLARYFKSDVNRFEIVKFHQVSGAKAVFDLFNKAIEDNEEGLIVKRSDSPYVPDDRSTHWLKLKSENFEGLSDTLDLLIVGGFYGSGFRAGGKDEFDHITVFLCAACSKADLKDPAKSKFVPITKVGTGYSLHELSDLRRGLKDQWKPFRVPPDYWPKWTPGPGERPDYFIKDPSKSVILELKAAEIVPSEKFPSGFTLRFPKTYKIRYDKSWDQATSISEIGGIMESYSRGITEKNAKIEEVSKEQVKKRKSQVGGKGDVLTAFKDTDTSGIVVRSTLFEGIEFYVVKAMDKAELERIIVEHGGSKVQNFMKNTRFVIAEDCLSMKVQTLIEKQQVNIIKPLWIYDCIKYSYLVQLVPKYVAFANNDLQAKFNSELTKYGDSLESQYKSPLEVFELAQQVSDEDLTLMMRHVLRGEWWKKLPLEISKTLSEIRAYQLITWTVFINGWGIEKDLCSLQILSRGGRISENFTEKVTHVVHLDSFDTFPGIENMTYDDFQVFLGYIN
jgi:DNA ligase-4